MNEIMAQQTTADNLSATNSLPTNTTENTALQDDESRMLSERDAARYIGMSMSFLAKDRSNGYRYGITHGPEFVRSGRRTIRYRIEDLDAWIMKNRVVRELPT
jgi:hypothetical protein